MAHTIPLSRTPDPNAPNKHSFNYDLNKTHFKMHNAKRSLCHSVSAELQSMCVWRSGSRSHFSCAPLNAIPDKNALANSTNRSHFYQPQELWDIWIVLLLFFPPTRLGLDPVTSTRPLAQVTQQHRKQCSAGLNPVLSQGQSAVPPSFAPGQARRSRFHPPHHGHATCTLRVALGSYLPDLRSRAEV